MPLVTAKCPNCSGELQVDNGKDAAICPYCGTAYIVEKAINYYTTKNETHIGSIAHADIHVTDSAGLETRIANAESFLTQHREYQKAQTLFEDIANEFSGDYRGWWGAARAMSREFTGIGIDPDQAETAQQAKRALENSFDRAFQAVKSSANHAFNVTDADVYTQLKPIWDDYERRYQLYTGPYIALRAEQFDLQERQYDHIVQIDGQLSKQRAKLARLQMRTKPGKLVALITFGLAVLIMGIVYPLLLYISIIPWAASLWQIFLFILRGRRKRKAQALDNTLQALRAEYQDQYRCSSELPIQLSDRAGFHDFQSGPQK